MSNITPENIKHLREKTGAGMMDCKNALVENNGNIEKSVSWLRKKGIAKAEKKSTRVASQGLVGLKVSESRSVLMEINTETDFVTKNPDFQKFALDILTIGITKNFTLDDLMNQEYNNNETISDALQNLIAKIGENIVIRRMHYMDNNDKNNVFGTYIHNKINEQTGSMACIVKITSDNITDNVLDLANKISMHITATKPVALDENSVNKDILNNEREIYISQLKTSGKPENIIDKIVEGKIRKYLSEITLINQNWVLDPSITVAEVIKEFNNKNNNNVKISDFKLLILGEGVEVNQKSFSEEVASQVNNTT